MGIQGNRNFAIISAKQGQSKMFGQFLQKAKWLAGVSVFAASTSAMAAPPLILNDVGLPVQDGSGQGKRAIWSKGGNVGGQNVDIVAVLTKATLNHSFESWDGGSNNSNGQPVINSVGSDDVQIEWRIYKQGTYDITKTDAIASAAATPVNADAHVQFNDVDGPSNEKVFVPVCTGDIKWIRIDADATTGRDFGTVNAQANIFTLIGDKNYNSQPESGLEIFYPNTSVFKMGRTANQGFRLRLGNPTYTAFDTLDYECADFKAPVAADDSKEGVPGNPTVINILDNDSTATQNNNAPNNNTLAPSEFGRSTVSLIAPPGATGTVTDAKGDIVGFTVPGEGTWAYDDITGALTFTPDPSFVGYATNIKYTVDNALGVASNEATVTVWYPGIGVTKSSTFNDTNGDGYAQVGETVDYIYEVKSYGAEPLRNVSIAETGFTGAGTLPAPAYSSGDDNSDTKLDLTETWVYKATYALVSADLTSGNVTNSATGNGETSSGTRVSDTSDSSNRGDGDGTGTSAPGPNNDDKTNTVLAIAPITASNDSQTGTITDSGIANAFNVFGNDALKGVTPTPAAVTLSVVTPATNAGVKLDITTGNVSVASGTPEGTYTIGYKICEIGNSDNCATATATVIVTKTPSVVPNVCMLATRLELNGGFENPVFTPTSPDYHLVADTSVPGWSTNDSQGQIEIWDSGFLGTPSDSNDQFAELNANSAGTLVQTGNVNSRSELIVSWAHRAREGTDVATAMIGDNVGTSISTGNFSAGISAWVPHRQTIITGPSATQFNMAFTAVTSGNGSPGIGNFLDSVSACQTYVTSNNVITTQTDTNGDGRASAGDTITYQQTISNPAGNLRPLTGVTIDDTLTGNGTAVTPVSGDTNNDGVLDPGESWVFNVVYTITAADIAAGKVVTTSHANGNTGTNIIRSDDVTITTPFPITATADSQTGTIFAGAGKSNAYNVFDNDLLKGAAPTATNVTLSVVTAASNPNVTLDTTTGNVSVAPGTPAGTYTIEYKICETGNPTNCANAIATIVVSANTPITAATDAPAAVTRTAGGSDIINALTNDKLNGTPVAIGDVNLTVTTPASYAGVTLDPATGLVSVAPGTPTGTYTIDYKICEKINPTNCATSTVTVVVNSNPITASDDSVPAVNGATGNPTAFNAFANDVLNGSPVVATDINTTVTAAATPKAPGDPVPALDPATGNVSVPAGTPAGSYNIGYQICEKADPTNCKSAVITVVVAAAPIAATDDSTPLVNSANGGADLVNALTNDRLNGVTPVPALINLTVLTPASNAGVTIDATTGLVSVALGTPAGNYTIAYQICEKLNPLNCALANVAVPVAATPIAASDDTPAPVGGIAGGNDIINAFGNDKLNGVAVDPAKINATITTPAAPKTPGAAVPMLDPATGLVDVPANTPAGTYVIAYEICEKTNPTNCAPASVTVVVTAAPVTAVNDGKTGVNGPAGDPAALNLFDGDTVNGMPAAATNATLALAPTSSLPPELTFNPATGVVGVKPGTPAGTYSFDYQVCEKLNPTNCKIATASVTVDPSPIAATNDTANAVTTATGGANLVNALLNDTLNGVAVVLAEVNLTVTSPASNAGVTLDPVTGQVSVAPGTPAGNYTIGYQICEKLNPTNCANATIAVVVQATPIAAANDSPAPVNGTTGNPNAINAFANDMLNGDPVDPAKINTTIKTPASNSGVVMDPATGNVGVAPGTPAGTYTIEYQICEKANPTNCKTATVTVVVAAAPIAAKADAPAPVNGTDGGNDIINALTNDTLNGVSVMLANIDVTVTAPATSVTPGAAVPILDPATGLVDVPAGTPAGTYTIGYKICEKLNPTNCADTVVTIIVTAAPIAAAPDTPPVVNGATGNPAVTNAFTNDTLNGAPVDPAKIVATVKTPASNPGVVLDPVTGTVAVAPGTPAGTYTIAYEICEKLNPTNCATSAVTVVVNAAPIAATPDTPPAVNGATGNPAVTNAFTNDTLNGAPVDPAKIVATVKTPASNPGVVLDPVTGTVAVAPGTPAGTYTIAYEICEKLNPTNCATSAVTVVVNAAPIAATNDDAGSVPGVAGGKDLVNALVNDSLNGKPADIAKIDLTVTTPASNPGVTLDPATGLISVAPNTPAGTYSIGYQICEKLNPTNCATATVAVIVKAAAIAATPDAPAPVNGALGGNDIINAFANDMLNGAPVVPANITATVTAPAAALTPGAPVPVLDPATGLVDVPAGTPAGTYTIGYQICEKLNPTNCANSTVTVVVEPPAIAAANDTPAPVRQGIGNPAAINAFANDMLNGKPVDPALITATVLTPAINPGVVLDPATGTVSVAADVPTGTYVIEYQICEKLNPTNCKTATVKVVVEPPVSAVTGTVFSDTDGDGKFDANEPRRAGWIVEVVRDGKVVATAKTDANGEYRIDGLPSGPGYEIVFRNPENNVVYDKIKDVTLGANITVIDQNQPIDPSGVFFDSITRQPIAGVTVRLTDANGVPLPAVCFADASQANQTTGASGEYRFDIVPGAAPQCPVGETVYRIIATPPAGYAPGSNLLLPQPGPFDPTGLAAPVRINPNPSPPTTSNPPFYLSFRLAAGDPDIINNHIALDPFLNRTPLIVTKTSIKRSASIGDIVPYEITVRNAENFARSDVSVVDILPAGMKYVMGTANIDGIPAEPVKTDRQLSWAGQVIPANGAKRYRLTLIVGAGVTGGEKVNTGLAQNGADNAAISNRGTAVISITPNAVFDCSELLGKVFEDTDRDGYQDENEPGVPGVRLATVNGQLITTDEFGRYHIACAAVPDARIGSNFVLKVDTRTLPLGWDTTTDNPRSIRLTRGKFGELNFGVAPKEEQTASPGDTSNNRNEKGE